MRAIITLMAGLLVAALPCYAANTEIRDVKIHALIKDNGDIAITEDWDITAKSSITEWYLPRTNLREIDIVDFAVKDNVYGAFTNIGEWDVDASFAQKTGKCGLVTKYNGYELCWGIGSYGDHLFTISYTMTNACKSAIDADYLHLQFLADNMDPAPEHAKLIISLESGEKIDTTFCKIWGFGFYGNVGFSNGGAVVMETDRQMGYDDSIIALVQFEKDHIHPVCVREENFQDVLDRAREGSDFDEGYGSDNDLTPGQTGALIGGIGILAFLISFLKKRKRIHDTLGPQGKKDIQWYRDVPFDGSITAAAVTLSSIGEGGTTSNITAAIILDMIKRGAITTRRSSHGKVELVLTDREAGIDLGGVFTELFSFLHDASGADQILQEHEFSVWSKKNATRLGKWVGDLSKDGVRYLTSNRYRYAGVYTPAGQKNARNLLGLKKYLEEFTLVKEREVPEVGLWKDYLTYAALFGIADKVAEQLKEIDPGAFRDIYGDNIDATWQVIRTSNSIARSLSSTAISSSYSSSGGYTSYSGGGGHSSHSGGGGFSGGGHGGGGR
ncbi:MAG: DUF2207 domain-containing protein [Bacteroidales bacterium]|nr:DUF2207 domain-containing protein [Bacteroidales bacterium]